jgi:hypothetical protein
MPRSNFKIGKFTTDPLTGEHAEINRGQLRGV